MLVKESAVAIHQVQQSTAHYRVVLTEFFTTATQLRIHVTLDM